MSVINCRQCKKEVEKTAKICPHCQVGTPCPTEHRIEQATAVMMVVGVIVSAWALLRKVGAM